MFKSHEDSNKAKNTPSDYCKDLQRILEQAAHLADLSSLINQSPSASSEAAIKDYLLQLCIKENDDETNCTEVISIIYYACVRLSRKREEGIMICNLTEFEGHECSIILDSFINDVLPLIEHSQTFALCHEIQMIKLLNASVLSSENTSNSARNLTIVEEVLKSVKRGLELCKLSSNSTANNTDFGRLETEAFLIQSLLTCILKMEQQSHNTPHLPYLNDNSAITLDVLLLNYLPFLKNNLVSSISSTNSFALFNSSDAKLLLSKLTDTLFTSNLILLSSLYTYHSIQNPSLQLETLQEAASFMKYLKLSIKQGSRMTCLFRLCNLFLQHSDVAFAAFFAFLVRNSKNVEKLMENKFDSLEFLERFDEDAVLEVLEGEEGKIVTLAVLESYNDSEEDKLGLLGDQEQPTNSLSPTIKRIKILISKLNPKSTEYHKKQ